MKKILYVGNDLVRENVNTSVMRTLGPALEAEGYTLYYTSPKTNKFFRLCDMLFSLAKYHRKVDVILIDTYSTLNFYYALFVAWFAAVLKVPYIPILHGGNLVTRLKTSSKLSHLIFDNAIINVSPSRYLKAEFERFGYKNIVYIPNTINIERYGYLKKSYDHPKLLWVRSLASIYNPKQAILVQEQLRSRGYDAELCMVGPDRENHLDALKTMAWNKQLEVKFTGKLTKQEWVDLSSNYNIFINTTNIDNMPVSVIEAMALGFPIVSTDVGGMPYLIEQNHEGVLVQTNNVDAMTDAIINLFKDKTALQSMSTNARATAETFDWEQVKHHWFDVLERDNRVGSV